MEAEVPSIAKRHEIVARQVMSIKVKCLRPVERAGVVYDLLQSCPTDTFLLLTRQVEALSLVLPVNR
jgi:chloride channel 7